LKRQVQQMQEEAEKLEEIQKEVEAQMGTSPSPTNSQSIDSRSVYVGNVQAPTPTHPPTTPLCPRLLFLFSFIEARVALTRP
jgi:hypothetical protein